MLQRPGPEAPMEEAEVTVPGTDSTSHLAWGEKGLEQRCLRRLLSVELRLQARSEGRR